MALADQCAPQFYHDIQDQMQRLPECTGVPSEDKSRHPVSFLQQQWHALFLHTSVFQYTRVEAVCSYSMSMCCSFYILYFVIGFLLLLLLSLSITLLLLHPNIATTLI